MRSCLRFRNFGLSWSLLFALTLFFSSALCQGSTIIVPADQPTIQAGIDAAVDFDTVLVQPGTYSGPGNEAIRFNGKSLVLKSESGAESTTLLTIDTVRTIYFDNNEDSNAVLDGFSISGGYENDFDWAYPYRGGIFSYNASPQIINCNISGCYSRMGGGIYLHSYLFREYKPLVEDCIIQNNKALFGGGMMLIGVETLISGCVISENSVDKINGQGGGINSLAYTSIHNCIIRGNKAAEIYHPYKYDSYERCAGGGISTQWGAMNISGCLFNDNWSRTGGVIYSRSTLLEISESTFYNNKAKFHSGIVVNASSLQFGGLLLDGNSFVNNYSLELASDGVAILKDSPLSSDSNFDSLAIIYGLSLAKSVKAGEFIIKNNVFAFNSSSPIYWDQDEAQPEISYNNLWSTVASPNYGGLLEDQTGLNGNISDDPLFCEMSDSIFTVDDLSPCLKAGENGIDIGGLAVGCNLRNGTSPESIVIDLNGGQFANQDSIQSALSRARPWDTLQLDYTNYATIDSFVIDKPLYIIGLGMDEGEGIIALHNTVKACIDIRSFCILRDAKVSAVNYSNSPYIVNAIKITDCSPIIFRCDISVEGSHLMADDFPIFCIRSNPYIRESAIYPGGYYNMILWDCPKDIIASYNYWYWGSYGRIDEYIVDGLDNPGQGRVLYYPFLTDTPTDIDDEQPISLPTQIILSQNYPNPFNPVTRIEYSIPRSSHVKLEIFDILGRKVITLINNFQPAGEYKQDWLAENQASGIYFYKLSIGEETETRKMVLLK